MAAPDIEKAIRKDLEDLKHLYMRTLPVKVGRAVQSSIRENFRQGGFYRDGRWQEPLRVTMGFRGAPGQRGPLLSGNNRLMMSTDYEAQPGRVIMRNPVDYASTHNDGADIGVTQKMKKFFWAQHMEHKDRLGSNAPETEFWKRMALKKPGSHIKIPRRHFMGPGKEVDAIVSRVISKELQDFVKTHDHGKIA